MIVINIIFWISFFLIFWANIGYPLSLLLINKLTDVEGTKKNYSHVPTVTIMVVAHNEEKVIESKLNNIIKLNYPQDKIKYLISSDNSTDATNSLVEKFIEENPTLPIQLYNVKERMGKTNAQNEAQKLVDTEYLVMTDANSIIDDNAIIELMATFTDQNISYVCGKLVYTNKNISEISDAESSYWNLDLLMRSIEGKLQTITAGNGALYACRNKEYIIFSPLNGHDISMPTYFALKGNRALMNSDALVYEKAGETIEDEFGRRVRMNRNLLKRIMPTIKILNVLKYKWYTYFYLGHRTTRYLLWLSHLLFLTSNVALAFYMQSVFLYVLILQLIVYGVGYLQMKIKSKSSLMKFISHYIMVIFAQWFGVYKIITGNVKPFWEKAETTR